MVPMTWEFLWALAATGGLLMAVEHAVRANRLARDRNHVFAALITLCAVLDQEDGKLPPELLGEVRGILDCPTGRYWNGALETIGTLLKSLKKSGPEMAA